MADATVSKLEVKDGVLHITGTNFTMTTTTVYVDDATVEHVYVSSTELTIDPAPAAGAEIVVDKGGVQTDPLTVEAPASPTATAEPGAAPSAEPTGGDEAANPSQLQPYPHGNPPDPEDEFEKIHGFRRAPAKEAP